MVPPRLLRNHSPQTSFEGRLAIESSLCKAGGGVPLGTEGVRRLIPLLVFAFAS